MNPTLDTEMSTNDSTPSELHEQENLSLNAVQMLVRDLTREVEILRAERASSLDPSTQTARRKPLPTGPPFDGNKAYYKAWALTIAHKLTSDAAFIGSPRDQYALIWTNLAPNVQREVSATYEKGGPNRDFDPEAFLGYLRFCYEDNHSREKAQANLDSLRQGKNESFADFFPRFEQLLSQSGGEMWDDEQKLHKLRSGLNPTIRQVALHRGVTRTDYQRGVQEYQSIAVDIETAAIESRSMPPPYLRPQAGRDAQGDVEMVTIGRIGTEGRSKQDGHSRQGKGAGRGAGTWIDPETFRRRREDGVCTRCARAGHFARECPNAVVLRAVSAGRAVSGQGENDSEN